MTKDKPSLDAAYALETPQDNLRLYANWADTYDSDFAARMSYRLHRVVAQAFVNGGGRGPVLDFGAGTGLVGQALAEAGVDVIDGTDLSPDMLVQAQQKGVYRKVFPGDMLAGLDVPDRTYQGATCAGTFTHGHVGPEALSEVLRVLKPGGLAAISINKQHFVSRNFDAELERLTKQAEISLATVAIYGEGADSAHAADEAMIATLRRK